MSQDGLDPLIHPARLRLMVTLAALPPRRHLSFARLQDMLELTPGNLITHLRKLEEAGYVRTKKTGSGTSALTTVALTHKGRAARQAEQQLKRRSGMAPQPWRPRSRLLGIARETFRPLFDAE